MSNGEKRLLIISGLLFLLGIVMFVIGFVLGGGRTAAKYVKNFGTKFIETTNTLVTDVDISFDYKSDINVDWSSIPARSEVSEKDAFADQPEFKSLVIYVSGGDIVIHSSSDGTVGVDGDGKAIRTFVKDDIAYVTADTFSGDFYINSDLQLDSVSVNAVAGNIELSAGANIGNVEVNSMAGNVELSNVNSDSVKVYAALGNIELHEVNSENLEVDALMGNIEVSGDIRKNAHIAAIGNIELVLDRSENDYNYKINLGAGELHLGHGKEYSGVGLYKNISHGSDSTIEVGTSAGNIEINFR